MTGTPEICRTLKALYGPAPGSVAYGVAVTFTFYNNSVPYAADVVSPPTLPGGTQAVSASCSRYSDQAQRVPDSATTITGATIAFPTAASLRGQSDPQETAKGAALSSLQDTIVAALATAGITWPPQ
jgi:hypothetical protein